MLLKLLLLFPLHSLVPLMKYQTLRFKQKGKRERGQVFKTRQNYITF